MQPHRAVLAEGTWICRKPQLQMQVLNILCHSVQLLQETTDLFIYLNKWELSEIDKKKVSLQFSMC
jgi:hypothetical protein